MSSLISVSRSCRLDLHSSVSDGSLSIFARISNRLGNVKRVICHGRCEMHLLMFNKRKTWVPSIRESCKLLFGDGGLCGKLLSIVFVRSKVLNVAGNILIVLYVTPLAGRQFVRVSPLSLLNVGTCLNKGNSLHVVCFRCYPFKML